ncbi:MAG: hypothetical protein ABIO94_13420 [Opitutaceae bacterium]
MHLRIKVLIWVYVVLLIIEGAMRKWLLPSMADYLLVIRDPVLLLIYALAVAEGVFPTNNIFMGVIGALAGASVLFSFLGGNTNPLVIAYGVRINYLHLPLIWIFGAVLNRRDVERLGTFLLLMAIPMTFVMVRQFDSPQDAWINRGVGADDRGQIFGADGRIRAPGLFAFITGPQLFYPLVAAFFFDQLGGTKRMPWYLLIVCGVAIAIALPVSISRTVMIATGIVAAAFVCTLPMSSSRLTSLARPFILVCLVLAALTQMPIFKKGTDVFMMRWDQAAQEAIGAGEDNAWASLSDRTIRAFTNTGYFLGEASLFGEGIGMGSNVGSRLTTGMVGFGLAEEEWGKIILELGPLLGLAFIAFRIWLTFYLGIEAWRALRNEKDALPLMIWAALMIAILQGQWAPPTVLGFAVLGGGLILAALNPVPESETDEVKAKAAAVASAPVIFGLPTHAALPEASNRRPPIVIRTIQK